MYISTEAIVGTICVVITGAGSFAGHLLGGLVNKTTGLNLSPNEQQLLKTAQVNESSCEKATRVAGNVLRKAGHLIACAGAACAPLAITAGSGILKPIDFMNPSALLTYAVTGVGLGAMALGNTLIKRGNATRLASIQKPKNIAKEKAKLEERRAQLAREIVAVNEGLKAINP